MRILSILLLLFLLLLGTFPYIYGFPQHKDLTLSFPNISIQPLFTVYIALDSRSNSFVPCGVCFAAFPFPMWVLFHSLTNLSA
jgi:hypothetical protein